MTKAKPITFLGARTKFATVDGKICVRVAGRWVPKCGWFAMCERPAETECEHPVFGAVPICARCDAWNRSLERKPSEFATSK